MQDKPNFLLIIADDLGFSDIGCFGGEIQTPNLDKLALQGTRFTNFHTAAACSPTRSMILSGTDNHLVGLGGMIEIRVLPSGEAKYNGRPGHEGFLSTKVATLPEVLHDGGYHTVLAGKWHLGNKDNEMPSARGFDRDWTFAWGAANHYAWEPQFQAGNHDDELWGKMLRGLWTKDHMYAKNGSWINMEPNYPLKPGGYYSSTTFTDQLLNFLSERKSDANLASKPFFAYHAFTAPHWPLQAPRDVREKYKGMYDDGPAALRLKRLARLKKLGLVDPSVEPHPVENPMAIQQWEGMSPENRAKSARAMETYAAMVEMIDRNVGRVIDQLERDGELDNTVVIFMSDNGAEGGALESAPITGTSVANIMTKFHDNSLDNIGEPNSFVWYGPFWAQAATAPGRLFKMCSSQGGIRVPFLVRMPPALLSTLPEESKSRFQPGGISREFATCRDLMPTFLDLGGATHPVPGPESGTYKGREGVLPMTGKSWVPWLQGKVAHVYGDDEEVGWELHGRAAFRKGQWKIVFMPPPYGKGEWELYDIHKDEGEVHDLAQTHPEIVKDLLKGWDEYVVGKGVLWGLGGDPDPTNNPNLMQDETLDPEGWMNTAKMA